MNIKIHRNLFFGPPLNQGIALIAAFDVAKSSFQPPG